MSETNDNNKTEYEEVCVMCHRPESKAGKMFHLPGGMCVCDDCMHQTMDMISKMDPGTMTDIPGFPASPVVPSVTPVPSVPSVS